MVKWFIWDGNLGKDRVSSGLRGGTSVGVEGGDLGRDSLGGEKSRGVDGEGGWGGDDTKCDSLGDSSRKLPDS